MITCTDGQDFLHTGLPKWHNSKRYENLMLDTGSRVKFESLQVAHHSGGEAFGLCKGDSSDISGRSEILDKKDDILMQHTRRYAP